MKIPGLRAFKSVDAALRASKKITTNPGIAAAGNHPEDGYYGRGDEQINANNGRSTIYVGVGNKTKSL